MAQCVKKFGDFNPCDSVLFEGFEADSSGLYTLHVRHLGTVVEVQGTQVAGEDISFSLTSLNENYTYTGWVTDENGDTVRFSGMETVQFSTRKTITYAV